MAINNKINKQIKMNTNINTFNNWALDDRDESMAKGHYKPVMYMIDFSKSISNNFDKPFRFLDIGCGNGWVIREMMKNKHCQLAQGIDGAENMINKANNFNLGNFIHANIENYSFNEKFNIVFSMETFYYFKNPKNIIEKIYKNVLDKNGLLIIGIDHYKENKSTLNWDKEYNLELTTLSIKEWKNILIECGFNKIKLKQINKKENWEGTLTLFAIK